MLRAKISIEKIICKKIAMTALILFGTFAALALVLFDKLACLSPFFRIVLFLTVLLVLTLALSFRIKAIIRRHISEPLKRLSRLTDEVAGGNYLVHAEVTSANEIGCLADNFNFMIDMTSKHASTIEEQLNSSKAEIGELKSCVEKLRRSLLEYDGIRRDFNSLVSFDIKTPVNAMINYVETVYEPYNKSDGADEKKAGDFKFLVSNIRNSYLDFFAAEKIGGENIVAVPVKTDFTIIVNGALDIFKPLIDAKKINVKKDLAPELSSVKLDTALMAQIVGNFVGNAVKFCPREGVITISSCVEGDNVSFTVSNSGAPCSEELIEKMTGDDFDSSSRGSCGESGFGFGLKLCKLFIEASGGKFDFNVRDGSCASFSFKVPAQRYRAD